jgi:polysaccharide chain length determinant protein (PEP-CTERM system associated)
MISLIAAIVALALPPIYTSTATILIEEQEIPQDYVMTTVTSFAEQRLQTITQRIMSYTKLLEIIERFGLYSDLRKKRTNEEVVTKMRKDIALNTISAEVVDRRTGRPTTATIAFTLAYEGKDPRTVQQVANTLMSLYLEENLRVRERQAEGASEFLENEMEDLQARVAELEAKIAAFKKEHLNELPELLEMNLQGLERTERDIERLKDRLGTLKEREGYLQVQLASLPLESENQDLRRLNELRTELAYLETRFSDKHPDVIDAKAEIAELEKRVGSSGEGPSSPGTGLPSEATDRQHNPAYVTLASQLASTEADIKSVKEQIADLEERWEDYRRRVEATPKVEETYTSLLAERNNTQRKVNDLMAKVMEARVAHGLEKEQKGERFTPIDRPRFPEKPSNAMTRLAVFLVGVVLGLAAGVGTAAVREYTDDAVHSAGRLTSATSFPVLTMIPEIVTERDRAKKKTRQKYLLAGALIAVVGGVVLFHFVVMDLDVFWIRVMRRITLL